MTDDGEKKRAALTKAADLVLKGSGIAAIAGVLAAASLEAPFTLGSAIPDFLNFAFLPIILSCAIGIAAMALAALSLFVFTLAIVELEDRFWIFKVIPTLGNSVIGGILVLLIGLAMMGLMLGITGGTAAG